MIESNLGDQIPDSPMQQRPWVWGGDGLTATPYRTSNTVVVLTDRSASVETDDEFNPA
jgi:hypothetical protein